MQPSAYGGEIMAKRRKCKPYFIAIEFVQGPKLGKREIWKDYDLNHVWGSPLYKVLGYTNTHTEAKALNEI